MHLATSTATAPLRVAKRGKTRSREELAQTNVLAKSNGYEQVTPAQRIDREVALALAHDLDPHVVEMQDGILRFFFRVKFFLPLVCSF
jgi:hypothetical protein